MTVYSGPVFDTAVNPIGVEKVRAGRKPGTRVMSVRDGACGVHMLLLERTGKA